ncbi:hypothetical protein IGI04_019394 [Brassica rapa subsp. trilocularis]|uniref:Uncharacterized protein n=1 Tax=Brassica rapa subsp. trilocularis TaxID=1813537 RepID=A0ABQ7MGK2_BRACM|nr:hypothetical protein IGI04_019394 [Brassica rapa subsp. trilocularis]
MIQSPKPAKPVLHLPQLEASRFNQLQTRHWRPGDHFNQSGDILGVQEDFCKFIPCTSNHWIRRILIYFNLPYLESQALKLQQLFFLQIRHDLSTFQTIKKVPRKLSYTLKPSRYKDNTIYIHLAKILTIKPPTASFHGAINSFASKALWRPSSHFHPPIDLESDTHPARPVQSSFIFHPSILVETCIIHFVRPTLPISSLDLLDWMQEEMEEAAQCQALLVSQKQLLAAIKGVQDQIAQLEKRNKAQYQRTHKGNRSFGDAPEAIRPNKRPMVFYDQYQPYKVPKAMEKKNLVSQDTLARHKEKSAKPIFQEKAKVSPILDKFVYKSSPTGMSHLYLSKDVKTGPEVEKDTISTSLLESKSMLLKEAKPVNEVSYQGKCLTPPRDTSTDVCVLDVGSKNESYLLTEVPQKEPDHKLSHEPPHKNVATKTLKDNPLQKRRNDHVKSRGVIHYYFLK